MSQSRGNTMLWLLNHGADVNALGYHGWAPLHNAAYFGRLQGFQMLVEHNANIHVWNDFGELPLHKAASHGVKHDHIDIMQILLDRGANPNARDNDGSTPLHHSSWYERPIYSTTKGTVEGTSLLLKHGAIIDAENNEGRTPLQLALEHGSDDIATCLKEHGAMR